MPIYYRTLRCVCVCLGGPPVYLTHFVVTLSVGLEEQLRKISAAAARLLAELILLVSRSCCRLFFVFPSYPVCLFTSLKFKEETCKVFFLINLYYFKIVLSSIFSYSGIPQPCRASSIYQLFPEWFLNCLICLQLPLPLPLPLLLFSLFDLSTLLKSTFVS